MKEIDVRETIGIGRLNEPVSFGIPFRKGELDKTSQLTLVDRGGNLIPLQAKPLNLWPDGSLKWVLLDFQATVEANCQKTYTLNSGEVRSGRSGLVIKKIQDSWDINTGKSKFVIGTNLFLPFQEVSIAGKQLFEGNSSNCILYLEGKKVLPKIKSITLETDGWLRSTLLINGSFRLDKKRRLNFISRLHFFLNKSLVKIDFTLQNPHAAYHPGGLWDLGDKGSILFDSFCFVIPLPGSTERHIEYSLEHRESVKKAKGQDLLIYQESSGGNNWKSPNHLNRDGRVPFQIKGYEVYEKGKTVGRGDRSTPVLWSGTSQYGISSGLSYFWQNFPKSLEVKDDNLIIGLFPESYKDGYELQGGEQKTESIYIDFSSKPSDLLWVREPLVPTVKSEEYEKSGAVSNFKLKNKENRNDCQELINVAIEGENSFFAKREIIDEYGWRSFGEVYADHEAVNHKNKALFISHYNNQYDLIYGSARQFMQTSNIQWYKLMKELVMHVRDIDIYHTEEDRDEYNNGLFWHTDHYIDAATATHRTHSKKHLEIKDPQYCGGGPGAEHCYTTGLMYHYLLTGDVSSKEATIGLANWVIKSLGSPSTLVGLLYKLKKDLPVWKNVAKGVQISSRQYPLSRATGNALVACLDAFQLSRDHFYLQKAETFIKGCVNPGDDIESYNLLDAESAWSYTVFLSALGRYLDEKIEMNEIDTMYQYAQKSLLVYAKWMLKNEYPYLEKKERLEFPNETWSAQDMRKSCVLYYAAKHAADDLKKDLLERALFFFKSSVKELQTFKTSDFTRPIALLLQNMWVQPYLSGAMIESAVKPVDECNFVEVKKFLTLRQLSKKMGGDLIAALKNTSLKKECQWITVRLKSRG